MSEDMRKTIDKFKSFKQFVNENVNNNNKLKDNINIIIDKFTTKYGKKLAAHPHIKRVENDILWKLAQDIDKYLISNYGNDKSYRKILNIIDDFTSGDALFNDNNTTLAEKILKELGVDEFTDDEDILYNHEKLKRIITKHLNKKPFTNNADWGGGYVWNIETDDNFLGTFLYLGDDELVVIKRTLIGDEYNDEEIKNITNSKELYNFLLSLKK